MLAALAVAGAGLAVALPGPGAGDPVSVSGESRSQRSAEVPERAAAAIREYEQVRRNAGRLVTAVAAPLHKFGCKALGLDDAAAQAAFETAFPLAAAHLTLDGRCFERWPRRARALIEKKLAQAPMDSEALALLGSLYERGWAVEKDQGMARRYYKRAALAAGWRVLGPDESKVDPATRELASFWGVSPMDMWLRFINPVTGPWELPETLKKETAWVESVIGDGPKRIMDIAVRLRRGRDGLPRDAILAFRWLQAVAVRYDYSPAFWLFADWIRDKEVTRERRRLGTVHDRHSELRTANYYLLKAAKAGDTRGDETIYRLLLKAPDYPKKDWALYYWLDRLKRQGHDIDESVLAGVLARLIPEDRQDIERFVLGKPDLFFTRLPAIEIDD